MGYTIKDRETGKTTYAKDVKIEGDFIKTNRGDIYHGRNVDVNKCFIATASGADPETLSTLRAYREIVLKGSSLGRVFIAAYYRIGPWCAALITPQSWLGRLVKRLIIAPVALFARRRLERGQPLCFSLVQDRAEEDREKIGDSPLD